MASRSGVSKYQQCLSDLQERREQFRLSPRHQFLYQQGDRKACPRILAELADSLNAWNEDVGRLQVHRGQNDARSTLVDNCLQEVSRNLGVIKDLFNHDAGEQEIDNDQR